MFSICVVDVSPGLSVLPRCRCLHIISLYFCPAGSGTVSQVLIDTLTGRPCRVLISLWFDSLAAPLPSLSPQMYNLLADTCCALAFPGGYFQHAGDRTTRMHLQLSLWFQILVSDLWPSFFFPHSESSDLPDKWCVNSLFSVSKSQREAVRKGLLLSVVDSLWARLPVYASVHPFIHSSV